jgi:hypothetical protein
VCFVFFNALTGDTTNMEAPIAPPLREAGRGPLADNTRGPVDSRFSPDVVLDADLVVAGALRLPEHVQPSRPVRVGLSIGGLFAARGLVLINTLRQDSARLRWIGDALARTVGDPRGRLQAA